MTIGSGQQAIADVETYIANTTAFQSRGGDSTAAAAKRRVLYGESDEPEDMNAGATLASQRPYVILSPERFMYEFAGVADDAFLCAQGGVMAIFCDNAKPASYKESFADFWGWVTSVIDEISQAHRTEEHFRFEIALAVPPWRPALTERSGDDYWECVFVFTYKT